MRISISLTNYSWPGGPGHLASDLARVARRADEAGIDTLWVADHLVQADPTAPPTDTDMLEAYTVLGHLAARTERVRLGAMVSPVTVREPALLVTAVTTLDVLSGGRAWLGVGAGYHGAEATAMGLPLPPVAERFERLEELLAIAQRMWAGDGSPYTGPHHHLARPQGSPLPLTRPHPPVLVGGAGEHRTLRVVARHADACNVFDIPDGGVTVRRKLEVLARHCAEVGRPVAEVEKTLSTRLSEGESPDAFRRRCDAAAALGIEHLVVITSRAWDDASLATLAAVVPQVRDVRPA